MAEGKGRDLILMPGIRLLPVCKRGADITLLPIMSRQMGGMLK